MIDSLTSLRFFAALWVVLLHYTNQFPEKGEFLSWLTLDGARAVDFFFILSGYIMSHVYFREISKGTFDSKLFVVKRFARIYPLHLVTFLLYAALLTITSFFGEITSFPDYVSLKNIFMSVTMLHSWNVTDGLVFNGPSWSISSEFFAYVLFPVFGVIFVTKRPILIAGVIFILLFVFADTFSTLFKGKEFVHLTWDFGTIRILPEFSLGILMYLALGNFQPKINTVRTLGVAGIGTMLIPMFTDYSDYIFVVSFVLLISYGIFVSRIYKESFLNRKILIYLGEISYSLYMVHSLVGFAWFRISNLISQKYDVTIPQDISLIIAVLIAIAVSATSYKFIETPARTKITKLYMRKNDKMK